MELDKNDTKMIQGLAVLAMVCLHLFDRYDFNGLYHPFLYIGEYPLCFYLAQLSDWCVMGFAFCSGYSHYRMFTTQTKEKYKKRSFSRLTSLYCNYWLILVLVVIISMLKGQTDNIPGSFLEFLGNFSTIICTYNISWWYLLSYALIVIMSPWLLKNAKKYNSVIVILIFFSIYCIGYYFRYPLGSFWISEKIGKLFMTIFEYILGAIFAKEKAFTTIYGRIRKVYKCIPATIFYGSIIIIFIGIMLSHTLISGNIIFAPINGIMIILTFSYWSKSSLVKKFFLFMGTHSTNIWLTHLFLYASLFTNFVFIVKYPPLIFCFMIVLTVGISMMIELIMKPIREKIRKI